MILKIVKYPEPVLSQPGEPVTEFNAELRKFVADLFETTYASQGIGLAAPQVGVSKRLTVIDLSMGKEPKDKLVLINPEIIFSEGKLYEEEGCLSFPEIREKVVRAAKVRIRAQDVHGKWFEMDGEELWDTTLDPARRTLLRVQLDDALKADEIFRQHRIALVRHRRGAFLAGGEELLARAMQHEIDHLDGMLFIFRMSALKRDLNLRKIRKMQREGKW